MVDLYSSLCLLRTSCISIEKCYFLLDSYFSFAIFSIIFFLICCFDYSLFSIIWGFPLFCCHIFTRFSYIGNFSHFSSIQWSNLKVRSEFQLEGHIFMSLFHDEKLKKEILHKQQLYNSEGGSILHFLVLSLAMST